MYLIKATLFTPMKQGWIIQVKPIKVPVQSLECKKNIKAVSAERAYEIAETL